MLGPVQLQTLNTYNPYIDTDPFGHSHPTNTDSITNNSTSNLQPIDNDYLTAYTKTVDRASWHASDLTGRFPIRSRKGAEYVLVTTYKGYIHVEPQNSRSAPAYVRTFTATLRFFRSHGHPLTDLIADNERSEDLTALFRSQPHPVTVQYVPPHNHRANPAERAIRTFKNHFISILSATHIHFPLDLWDLLLPQAELTLNLLRPWSPHPTYSAWHGLHDTPFDHRDTPLHPPGQLVVCHDSPLNRLTWAPHGQRGYHLGPSLEHYRCYSIYIVHTATTRISDTLDHYPDPLFYFESTPTQSLDTSPTPHRPNPNPDGSDLLGRWFRDPDLGACQVTALGTPVELPPGQGNRAPGVHLPAQWHNTLDYVTPDGTTETSSLTEVADWVTRYPMTSPPTDPAPTPTNTVVPTAPTPGPRRSPRLLSAEALHVLALAGAVPDPPVCPYPVEMSIHHLLLLAGDDMTPRLDNTIPLLNLDPSGKPLTYALAIAGLDSALWITEDGAELRKLFRTKKCLVAVHSPASNPTYYKRVVKEKWDYVGHKIKRRVRGTAGGDRVPVDCCCSTATASMPLVKMHLNVIVSAANRFATMDISDFYLGADMPSNDRPSLKIYVDAYPDSLLVELELLEFVKFDKQGKPFIYADILKTIPGLKQSGLLSQVRLVTQLNKHGYYQTATPMLFRHQDRPIDFTLVVDDFGVQYNRDEDLDHLITCLTDMYLVKIERTGTRFLGFDIDYNMTERKLTMSCPGYLENLLSSVCPDGVKPAQSPYIYCQPEYGSTAPQTATVDNSPPATTAEAKVLQRVVGSILYYARAIDHSMLPAVCNLASLQSVPTSNTIALMDRLLGYASSHLSASVVIRP